MHLHFGLHILPRSKHSFTPYVIMLIGKLTYLERQHAKLEIELEDRDGSLRFHPNELKLVLAKKEKLENVIEDLDEDIAYLIYKIQREAKNA